MEKDQSVLSNAMYFGLIFGIILVVYNIVLTVTGLNVSMLTGGFSMMAISMVLSLILYFGGVFISQKQYRDKRMNGFISYGQSFTFGILVVVFASLLVAVYNFIYAQWINPDFGQEVYEISKQVTMDMLDRFNAPAEAVDEAMAKLEENGVSQPSEFAFSAITNGVIMGVIVSLLTSIFVKKKDDNPFAGVEETPES